MSWILPVQGQGWKYVLGVTPRWRTVQSSRRATMAGRCGHPVAAPENRYWVFIVNFSQCNISIKQLIYTTI
jgi:hypothetical protein